MYYQIRTICTAKGLGNNQEHYQVFDTKAHDFRTIEGIAAFLKDEYGDCKCTKLYQDIDGQSKQIGYVYCFNNDDVCHIPIVKWHQQDWVEIVEVHEKPALL